MIFLPSNIAGLSEVCAKSDTKYAITNVRVKVNEDGSYIADATDTRILARITGPGSDGSGHPCKPTLEACPNGGTQALIPGDVIHDALKQSAKAKKASKVNPALGWLGVQIAAPVKNNEYVQTPVFGSAVLATSDGSANRIESVKQPECERFPPFEDLIPSRTKKPDVRFRLDINYLRKLLDAAQQVSDSITLEAFRSSHLTEDPDVTKPIIFRSHNDSGQEFTGLVLPLSPEKR